MKLVLLPGLDGTGIQFRPLLRALPAQVEPVVLSYPLDSPLGYDALYSNLRCQLPLGEDYMLLGESFGGPLSIRLAADNPERLKGLILCATFVRCPQMWAPAWSKSLVFSWPFSLFPKLAQAKALLGGYATSGLLVLVKEALEMVSPTVLAHRVREVISVDVSTELQAAKVPLLYLRGESDYVVPAANCRQIQTLRPDAQIVQISAPHMLLQTQPQLAAKAIAQFMAERG